MNAPDLLLRTWSELVQIYNSLHRHDSTVKYQALIIAMKDSLFNSKQAQLFRNIDFDEQQRQQEMENVKKTYREQVQKYGLLAGLIVFLSIAIILWRNNRNKQRAYSLLKNQKQETDFQKSKVEKTLDELRATQAQLIQSEKMASLGELTAGIAHEIQNPLNFVNNFSDINKELLTEMKDEIDKGNLEQARSVANNIIDNEEKINHHGKRADSIVKGMLQHSRRTGGQKEATDINALADEYLRLAYHGLRAKDKSFDTKFETNFDSSIGKINIAPQDIGRVLLNLINNAFYAVGEKYKQNLNGYDPIITVTTKRSDDKPDSYRVEIKVADNGNGIPQKIVDKIFQPFFTTKPTGQGTGLGLSLAYDTVKAHGGEINVETKEGEGSEFIIQLPAN
jgi:signal transduction histidine kinase